MTHNEKKVLTQKETTGVKNKTLALGTVSLVAFAIGFASCTDSKALTKPNIIYKDAPSNGVIAKIGGKTITEKDLISQGDIKVRLYDLKKQEYKLKMDQLKKMMREELIGAEAKKAKLSTAEFIEKQIAPKKKTEPSKMEFDAFVKERKVPKEQINDQLKERIMNYLREEKREKVIESHLAKLTKNNPVEVYFRKPKMDIKVEIGSSPVWGDESAPITIIEFSDFQCPFCSRANDVVEEVKKKYKGKVRVAFKHFPLSFHKQAKPAAVASMCINEQDGKKFWKYHDILFQNQKALGADKLEEYAKTVGADMDKFKACMSSDKYAAQVDADMKYGEKLGVRATPTFFVNGEILSGALPIEEFSTVIDEALTETKM